MEIPNPDITLNDIEPGADLRGADLSGANLSEVNLKNANLSEASLERVDFSGTNLDGADLSGVFLFEANLSEAFLFGANLLEADLARADLSEADLEAADLSKANLDRADLSGAGLDGANLSEAFLFGANLSEANLDNADLSGADLREADLSGADLREADLSGADLREADLSGANLIELNLSGAALSRETQLESRFADLKEVVSTKMFGGSEPPQMWDAIARVCHELKTASSENGLVEKARKYYIWERRARRGEAKAEGGLTGYSAWFRSLFSNVVTGYGVQLQWVGLVMFSLYLVSTAVYCEAGMGAIESFYYSLVTFTTAPPSPPPSDFLTVATAMVETFGGTLLIVILGYVLGNREQV